MEGTLLVTSVAQLSYSALKVEDMAVSVRRVEGLHSRAFSKGKYMERELTGGVKCAHVGLDGAVVVGGSSNGIGHGLQGSNTGSKGNAALQVNDGLNVILSTGTVKVLEISD